MYETWLQELPSGKTSDERWRAIMSARKNELVLRGSRKLNKKEKGVKRFGRPENSYLL